MIVSMQANEFEDMVDGAVEAGTFIDAVERLWVPGHEGHRMYVNPFGTVYCLTCMPDGITVSSVADLSDAACPDCGCFKTAHSYSTGKCLMAGCPCGS